MAAEEKPNPFTVFLANISEAFRLAAEQEKEQEQGQTLKRNIFSHAFNSISIDLRHAEWAAKNCAPNEAHTRIGTAVSQILDRINTVITPEDPAWGIYGRLATRYMSEFTQLGLALNEKLMKDTIRARGAFGLSPYPPLEPFDVFKVTFSGRPFQTPQA